MFRQSGVYFKSAFSNMNSLISLKNIYNILKKYQTLYSKINDYPDIKVTSRLDN